MQRCERGQSDNMIQKQLYCIINCLRSDVRYDIVSVHINDVIMNGADSRVAARSLRRSNSSPVCTACNVTIS